MLLTMIEPNVDVNTSTLTLNQGKLMCRVFGWLWHVEHVEHVEYVDRVGVDPSSNQINRDDDDDANLTA